MIRFPLIVFLLGFFCFGAHADGLGDSGGVRGIGANIYGDKSFAGGVTIHPTATDTNSLLLQGYSGSGTNNVLQVARYAGGKSVMTIGENSNPIITIQSDTDAKVPLRIKGNSATQSAALFQIYGNDASFTTFGVNSNGGVNITNPSDAYSYINFNTGRSIVFFNQNNPTLPSIQRYEASGRINFKTSSSDGAFDVNNFYIDNTGTVFGAPVSSTASCDTGYTRAAPEYCVNSTPSSTSTFSGVSCSIIAPPASAKVVDLFLSISGGGSVQVYTDSGCTTQVLNAVAVSGETAAVTRKILLPSTGANLRITGSGAYAFEGYND